MREGGNERGVCGCVWFVCVREGQLDPAGVLGAGKPGSCRWKAPANAGSTPRAAGSGTEAMRS